MYPRPDSPENPNAGGSLSTTVAVVVLLLVDLPLVDSLGVVLTASLPGRVFDELHVRHQLDRRRRGWGRAGLLHERPIVGGGGVWDQRIFGEGRSREHRRQQRQAQQHPRGPSGNPRKLSETHDRLSFFRT